MTKKQQLTQELDKVMNAEENYTNSKLKIIEYLTTLTNLVEDFDNPSYTARHNDGGDTHIGSIDWYAKQFPKLVIEMRKQRAFVKKTSKLRSHLTVSRKGLA